MRSKWEALEFGLFDNKAQLVYPDSFANLEIGELTVFHQIAYENKALLTSAKISHLKVVTRFNAERSLSVSINEYLNYLISPGFAEYWAKVTAQTSAWRLGDLIEIHNEMELLPKDKKNEELYLPAMKEQLRQQCEYHFDLLLQERDASSEALESLFDLHLLNAFDGAIFFKQWQLFCNTLDGRTIQKLPTLEVHLDVYKYSLTALTSVTRQLFYDALNQQELDTLIIIFADQAVFQHFCRGFSLLKVRRLEIKLVVFGFEKLSPTQEKLLISACVASKMEEVIIKNSGAYSEQLNGLIKEGILYRNCMRTFRAAESAKNSGTALHRFFNAGGREPMREIVKSLAPNYLTTIRP